MNTQQSWLKTVILGIQMLFVAFGALVLVPLLTGLDPSIALFTAGIGTLLFHLVTGLQVPVFLGSSFAFIVPIQFCIKQYGAGATCGALGAVGLVYMVLALMVKVGGIKVIHKYLPSVVIGPVIIVIGLKLAPVAVNMARSFDGSGTYNGKAVLIACISLLTSSLCVVFGKRIMHLIPILCGIFVGYVVSAFCGYVDFGPVREAAWFVLPWTHAVAVKSYALPTFSLPAILYMLPVTVAPAIEHVGDILAISSVTGKTYIKKPGLHRTLLGDGLATSLAGFLGGPPNTTYSEVTGAVALTRAFNPLYMVIAAITAVVLAFCGKLGALLRSIPVPVMGGIMIILFGMIAAIGINALIKNRVNLDKPRNMVIVSVILITGIGDMFFSFGGYTLGGIGLAGIIGVLLNIVLPERWHESDGPLIEKP